MTTNRVYSAVTVGIALSLYAYNVSPVARARRLYDHFKGECMDLEDLILVLSERQTYAMTELPLATARVYVQHALETYGADALTRVAFG